MSLLKAGVKRDDKAFIVNGRVRELSPNMKEVEDWSYFRENIFVKWDYNC